MSDIDSIIEKCIDDIWKTYDKDNSGFLDKEETKMFVKNTLSEMGENGEFSSADFEACFKEFDKDGNGTSAPPTRRSPCAPCAAAACSPGWT